MNEFDRGVDSELAEECQAILAETADIAEGDTFKERVNHAPRNNGDAIWLVIFRRHLGQYAGDRDTDGDGNADFFVNGSADVMSYCAEAFSPERSKTIQIEKPFVDRVCLHVGRKASEDRKHLL